MRKPTRDAGPPRWVDPKPPQVLRGKERKSCFWSRRGAGSRLKRLWLLKGSGEAAAKQRGSR